jgi:hypothetical protein
VRGLGLVFVLDGDTSAEVFLFLGGRNDVDSLGVFVARDFHLLHRIAGAPVVLGTVLEHQRECKQY